jgi:hypothetical protein
LIDTSEYYFSGGILVKKISNRAFKVAKQEVKVAQKLREHLTAQLSISNKEIVLPLSCTFDFYG